MAGIGDIPPIWPTRPPDPLGPRDDRRKPPRRPEDEPVPEEEKDKDDRGDDDSPHVDEYA